MEFEVEATCKYKIRVQASNADDAFDEAKKTDLEDWEQTWSQAGIKVVKEGGDA